MKSSRRQVVPKTKSDIIIRWKEIEKEFSFAGFSLSIHSWAMCGGYDAIASARSLEQFGLACRKVKTRRARELWCNRQRHDQTLSRVLAIFRDSYHDVWRNRRSTVSRVNYRCCSGVISLQLPKHTACINHLINIFLRSALLQVTAHVAPTFNRPLCTTARGKEKKNYAVMFSWLSAAP